jgi:NADPH:quinone reductase-like Zn-dependent oxidoreductase
MDFTRSIANLGLECAGNISRLGANASRQFKPGDSVLCWSPGSLATHVRVNSRYCVKIPEGLNFDEAVTFSTAHATMIRGFIELCSLSKGESVLIHSAAGAEGIAAIQIAHMIGAKVGHFLSRF